MYFQKPVGLEGQWRPLHCGGFCPGPSPAKWEAAKTAVPAVERGRGEGSPGGSGGAGARCGLEPPFGLKVGPVLLCLVGILCPLLSGLAFYLSPI